MNVDDLRIEMTAGAGGYDLVSGSGDTLWVHGHYPASVAEKGSFMVAYDHMSALRAVLLFAERNAAAQLEAIVQTSIMLNHRPNKAKLCPECSGTGLIRYTSLNCHHCNATGLDW